MQALRRAFAEALALIEAHRLVFVDESGVVQGMRSPYGYAPRGQRCVEDAPYHKGQRLSLIGWMCSGCGNVVGVPGPVDRATFEWFVEQELAPCLEPGDVVVWDNHTIHNSEVARSAVLRRGALLLPQPLYSPDMNAIEMLWSKVKGLVRRCRSDTYEGLQAALSSACASVRSKDLSGWVAHVKNITSTA